MKEEEEEEEEEKEKKKRTTNPGKKKVKRWSKVAAKYCLWVLYVCLRSEERRVGKEC